MVKSYSISDLRLNNFSFFYECPSSHPLVKNIAVFFFKYYKKGAVPGFEFHFESAITVNVLVGCWYIKSFMHEEGNDLYRRRSREIVAAMIEFVRRVSQKNVIQNAYVLIHGQKETKGKQHNTSNYGNSHHSCIQSQLSMRNGNKRNSRVHDTIYIWKNVHSRQIGRHMK